MRVVIVGKGGRESTLTWAMGKSPLVDEILGETGSDIDEIVSHALEDRADLVVVGPEVPLVAGLVDQLEGVGIPAFGPSAAAAMLEGSKIFMKELCSQHSIPTARWCWTSQIGQAIDLIRIWGTPVIKADGLCGGKGVFVAENAEEAIGAARLMLVERVYGMAGSHILIEDRLKGKECSMMFLCQDEVAIPLPPARDYKRAKDGDKGPNTGGMGAYSPLPDVDDALVEEVRQRIILPTLRAMKARGTPFRGILYAGLMLTEEGPMLLEYNVRFGDPETQVVLPRLDSDIVPYLLAIATNEPGALARLGPLAVRSGAAVCITLALQGYPDSKKYKTGYPITGLAPEIRPRSLVFHAGTERGENGEWRTASGRVLSVVGLGDTLTMARLRAEDRAAEIMYHGKYHRTDIAANI